MKTENLPKVITLKKDEKCFNCKKQILKGNLAIFSWWVHKKQTAYTHVGCG